MAAFTGAITPFAQPHTVVAHPTNTPHTTVFTYFRPQKPIQPGNWVAYANKGRSQAGLCKRVVPARGRRKGYVMIQIPGLQKQTKLMLSK